MTKKKNKQKSVEVSEDTVQLERAEREMTAIETIRVLLEREAKNRDTADKAEFLSNVIAIANSLKD